MRATSVVALGCWASAGTIKALGAGLGWLPAIMLGVITAVGGGILRDFCIGEIPSVLGGNTLYATAALAASAVLVITPHHCTDPGESGQASSSVPVSACWPDGVVGGCRKAPSSS